MKTAALYVALGSLCARYHRLAGQRATGSSPQTMATHCHDEASRLVKEYMPSGSGFDAGTTLVIDVSNNEELVFKTAFHHMDEHGGYDGWSDHKVRIKAQFDGFEVYVGGRDRNLIKDYIADSFNQTLSQEVSYHPLPNQEGV